MKITLQNAIKTSVFAIAIAFAGASHAEDKYNLNPVGGSAIYDTGAKLFVPTPGPVQSQGASMYQLSTDDFSKQFYAYCVEPKVEALLGAVYTATATTVVDPVKALFETAFTSTIGNDARQVSFQLALWEVLYDDGQIFDKGGKQYFSHGIQMAEDAQLMINALSSHKVENLYNYTLFKGAAGGVASQAMLGVSPVPEVETWAMLAAGLGLVGMMGRRRRNEDTISDEKFA